LALQADLSIFAATPTREQIDRLQAEMSLRPQAGEESIHTEHRFYPGIYCRSVWRAAGTLIVGKVHKQAHKFMCVTGEIAVVSPGVPLVTLKAGDCIESSPGTKRSTLAMTDAIGMTVHHTDLTDLDEIEAALIEPDDLALFDARNRLALSFEPEGAT
jgi:hypothetical protein